MDELIFLLGSERDVSVRKALKRFGTVDHAFDVDDALLLVAENDYSYFFIDADTPYAQAFIKHLRHDPHLIPPSAVVLLTDNEDEDCDAWQVDTFITKSRIGGELSYVFSHMKSDCRDPSNVIRISGEPEPLDLKAIARNRARERSRKGIFPRFRSNITAGTQRWEETKVGEASAIEEPGERKPGAINVGPDVSVRASARSAVRPGICDLQSPVIRVAVAIAFMIASAGVIVWAFTSGPLASSSKVEKPMVSLKSTGKEKRENSPKRNSDILTGETVEKYSNVNLDISENEVQPGASCAGGDAYKTGVTDRPGGTLAGTPARPEEKTSLEETGAQSEPPANVVQNRRPTVSISGPVQVARRQSVVYTAVARDPDGDSLFYSWGSNTTTRNWSLPGTYTISVTVTDSKGLSSTASITVRVI